MRNRIPIPPAKELRKILEYRDGHLYWKVDQWGNPVPVRQLRAGFLNRASGYRGVTINGVSYAEHRIIWRMHHPKGKMPFVLDHIDGNRDNNKIENLRCCTESENQNNRHPGKAPVVRGSGRLQQLLKRRRVQ